METISLEVDLPLKVPSFQILMELRYSISLNAIFTIVTIAVVTSREEFLIEQAVAIEDSITVNLVVHYSHIKMQSSTKLNPDEDYQKHLSEKVEKLRSISSHSSHQTLKTLFLETYPFCVLSGVLDLMVHAVS